MALESHIKPENNEYTLHFHSTPNKAFVCSLHFPLNDNTQSMLTEQTSSRALSAGSYRASLHSFSHAINKSVHHPSTGVVSNRLHVSSQQCVTSLISLTICWLGARRHRSPAFWQIQTASVERGLSQGLVQYGWVESQSVLTRFLNHPHLQGLWRKMINAGVGSKQGIGLEHDQT